MSKISVIDSIMGSRKTTWAIETIANNPDKNYIYITPYLDEIKRVKDATRHSNKMYEPNYINKTNKRDDLHRLLSEGKNICSTHALFIKANDMTRSALKASGYTLILDEVMNTIEATVQKYDEVSHHLLDQAKAAAPFINGVKIGNNSISFTDAIMFVVNLLALDKSSGYLNL